MTEVMESPTDGLGNVLEQGDVVAYAVAISGRRHLTLGVIWKITWHDSPYRHQQGSWHLGVYRRRARGSYRWETEITKSTLTELGAVMKVHPEHYNEVVADLIAAKAAEGA